MSFQLEAGSYRSYKGLPALAGLATIDQAIQCQWSVEESVSRLKRLHYVLKRLHETFTARITAEPIYELKTAFSYHAYLCAEQVSLIRRRVGEMREPPLGLDKVPHAALERFLDELLACPSSEEFLLGCYQVAIPAVLEACRRLQRDAHPLADAPSIRVARLIEFEITVLANFGEQAIACLVTDEIRRQAESWNQMLYACLEVAGGLDGVGLNDVALNGADLNGVELQSATESPTSHSTSTGVDTGVVLPPAKYSAQPYQYHSEPRRDQRFQDPFNAGVNPEAFLYTEHFPARAKTLMMYYKRIRELDVPKMMASILHELRDQEPWDFHMEMSRQLWDEARHAMMGEVGFVSQGIDWRMIPINFTWSRNLNTQLDARERHGVLFFIEQGLMPRTGKRYEWEVGLASGDPLSGLFQDFDWADEVLHAQIGRRWYVPRYKSLNEALAYGDRCWTKVVSHWRDVLERGLTEHRNWWPELYQAACRNWNIEPDPAALAFNTTYEDSRADLQKLS